VIDGVPIFDAKEITEKRIGAIGPHVWIKPAPTHKGLSLGNIRIGTSVKLRSVDPVAGEGCPRGWYAVEPRGYVCLNSRTTLDLREAYYQALRTVSPNKKSLWPYHYAYSRGAPMYSRVPTPAEWKAKERPLGPVGSYQELGEWAKGHEEMIEKDVKLTATDPVPWYFAGGKRHVQGGTRSVGRLVWKTIPNGSMLAYAKAFEMHGRVWLVTSDLTVVPADRVQHIRRHTFQGVELNDEVKLPIAWNRSHQPKPLYRQGEKGSWIALEETIGDKGRVMIEGKRTGPRNKAYYVLRDRPGVFVRGADITISWARKKLPNAFKMSDKWIDAHITPGTLTLYHGLKPLYATLFSPGKGGHPVPGNDHTVYATTQTGYFRLEWKERVATMSNEKGDPKVLWFSDVPFVQYIRAPLAMHVAYWHEDFSNPKSAECVNLSGLDGRYLFEWTEPKLPPDWGAVRPNGGFGSSTPIMINGF